MTIASVRSRLAHVPLTRPYAISNASFDAVDLVLLEIATDDGQIGHGQASPSEGITGETFAACAAALEVPSLSWLVGQDAGHLPSLLDLAVERVATPAARAAVDMALFELDAKRRGATVLESLGRIQNRLPTSITIGCKSTEETLEEAREYVGRGFKALKVKIGVELEEDLERLHRIREIFGGAIRLRADANQGYELRDLLVLADRMDDLDLEMIEQPLPPEEDAALRTLSSATQHRLAADESVHVAADLERLLRDGCPFGIINIKLMKCGGIREALRLARLAARAGLEIMWGCMDESALGIAAALHTAYACRATSYLDLDGSLDLLADPFTGGFELRDGYLDTVLGPGFGVQPA